MKLFTKFFWTKFFSKGSTKIFSSFSKDHCKIPKKDQENELNDLHLKVKKFTLLILRVLYFHIDTLLFLFFCNFLLLFLFSLYFNETSVKSYASVWPCDWFSIILPICLWICPIFQDLCFRFFWFYFWNVESQESQTYGKRDQN